MGPRGIPPLRPKPVGYRQIIGPSLDHPRCPGCGQLHGVLEPCQDDRTGD